MIMENKTTELQNKKNTAAIFSDIRQQVEDGKGFLSVCLENRKQKKRSAARKSIDDLEYALKLLGQKPTKEEYGKKERSFYWKKLTRLFDPESEIIDKQNVRCRKKQELRKKFLELTERIPVIPNTHAKLPAKGLNTKEFPEVWQDNAENTDKQKFLLFNYLTAQGISPEEARVQIENLLFENTQNNTLNE